jgi:drug/metabolite transporter (DMT)-like permease
VAGAAAGSGDHDVGLGPPVDRQRGWATAGLVGIALVWGATFSAVKDAVESMPSTDFLAIRFTLAAAAMIVLRPSSLRRVHRATVGHGVGLGVLLAAAYLAQTVALESISAGTAGVLTALLVLLAPLVGAITVRTPVPARVWAALVLGGAGLAVLATRSGGLGTGEGLTVLAAAVLAGHLVALAAVAERHDLWALTMVQLVTAATVLAVLAAPAGITAPPDASVWRDVLVASVLAIAIALLVQIWAQRRLPPTRVGLLLASEPVFAVLLAWTLAGEVVTWQVAAAGALVVAAVLIVELSANGERRAEAAAAPQP